MSTNQAGKNGMPLQNGQEKELSVEGGGEDDDTETQLLDDAAAPNKHDDGGANNDDDDSDDKDAESSMGSSAAEMSGVSSSSSSSRRFSSGGYSGDYSSISEDSSADRRAEAENKRKRKTNSNNFIHNDKGGHDVERIVARDGDGGKRCDEEAGAKKTEADVGGGCPPRPSREEVMDDHGTQLMDHSDLNGPVTGRRQVTSNHRHHQEPPSKDRHIHSYHRHNHGQRHHHPPRGGAKKVQQTEKVNKKIDEIMNLYSVSLQAVADEYNNEHREARGKQDQEENNATAISFRVEAEGRHHGLPAPSALTLTPSRNIQHGPNHGTSSKIGEPDVAVAASSQFPEGLEDNDNNAGIANEQAQSVCYANLMEACRPFFCDGHTLMKSDQPSENAMASQNQASSESSGFTSFFTSTKSDSNHTHSGGSLTDRSSHQPGNANQNNQENSSHEEAAKKKSHANFKDLSSEVDWTDSSMAVLVRAKRKHKASSSSDNSSDSRKRSGGDHHAEGPSKRVRIETVALDGARGHHSQAEPAKSQQDNQSPSEQGAVQHHQQRTESSSHTMSSLSQSLNSSGSDSGRQRPKDKEENGGGGPEGNNDAGENSPTEVAAANQPSSGKLRVVTSSSSGTNTTANTTGSSGSGTGSGNDNNTTSKSESGGSGDYGDNSEERKVVGERDDGSAGVSYGCKGGESSAAAPLAEGVAPDSNALSMAARAKNDPSLIHHHRHNGGRHELQKENGKAVPLEQENADRGCVAENIHKEDITEAMASKEKIMEKKRKRMNMRREYEEEVQRQMRDSSTSSSVEETTDVLEPGKPVTLEDVLSFTKTSRLLVQALPPFLAVHVNASFTSLCGIESSTAIGMPVASIISLPDTTSANKESDSSGSKDAMSSLSGSADNGNRQNSSNMAISNDVSIQRGAEAVAAQQQGAGHDHHRIFNEAGLRIDRLIVARGYGHVHDVDVLFLPHQSHAVRAIEGSEVKFVEGNSGPPSSAKMRRKNEENSSKILCRMSVSPVISAAPAHPSLVADVGHHHHHHGQLHPAEGISHHHSPHHPLRTNNKRRNSRPGAMPSEMHYVKHYLIQLEAVDGPRRLISRSSCTLSSTDTTVAAQVLGITKTEVQARRCRLERRPNPVHSQTMETVAAQQGDDRADRRESGDSQEEDASAMEPVATCG